MEPMTMAMLAAGAGAALGRAGGSGKSAYKMQKFDPYRSGQKGLLDKLARHFPSHKLDIERSGLYNRGYNYLKDLFSPDSEAMAAFEAPYLRQFNEEIIPSIAERFTQLGAGSQSSSAFNQALAQQAGSLQERLASLRTGMQMSALPQALGYAQAPVQSYFNRASLALGSPGIQQMAIPNTPGFGQQFGGALAGGLGQGAGIWGASQLMGALG